MTDSRLDEYAVPDEVAREYRERLLTALPVRELFERADTDVDPTTLATEGVWHLHDRYEIRLHWTGEGARCVRLRGTYVDGELLTARLETGVRVDGLSGRGRYWRYEGGAFDDGHWVS